MNNTPKVSVIIPVYNVEKYLRECLDSVINQTMKDIEVICVDDGSTDNSLNILNEYCISDSRVKLVRQQNCGAGAARNNGMRYATGEYLYFMDSDDYCRLDFFEKVVSEADKKETDILVFDYYKFDERTGNNEYKNGLVKNRIPADKNIFSYKDKPLVIARAVNPTPWNKLYRRSFVVDSNLKWLEVSTTNDITFATMSVLMAEKIGYLEEPFYYYRVNVNNSITSKKRYNQDNVIKAVLSVAEQSAKLPHFNEIKTTVREFIITNLFNALASYTPDENTAHHYMFAKKIDSIMFSHPIFLNAQKEEFFDKGLFNKYLESKTRAEARTDYSFLPEVIVSLTSFPGRIDTVYIALNSIYKQTVKPDRVILWLAETQFPNREEDLPIELLDYKALGTEIRWVQEDLRPHKKYFYVMQENPEAIVITIDDDLTYEPTMIEMLLDSYMKHPDAVSTVRTHLIMPEGDKVASYREWVKEFSGIIDYPSMQLFSTSGAGTLYPPHCLHSEAFNIENIRLLSPNADDLWLKVMQVLKGTPTVLVRPNKLLRYIPGTQEDTLQRSNVYQNANDIQLEKILSVYGYDEFATKVAEGYIRETKLLEQGKTVWPEPAKTDSSKQTISSVSSQKNLGIVLLEQKIEKLEFELTSIKNSKSFKIGRRFTWLPRKIRGGIRCYHENGLKYTVKRIVYKLKKVFK